MSKTLHVYLFQSLVGVLTQNQHGEITFQYESEWLGSEIASPLSRSLPLRQEPFTPRQTRPFFGGVLPEAGQREKIANNLGVSSKNYFALLDGIGGEYQPKKIQLKHLERLADEAEFGRASVKRRVRSVCQRVTHSIHSVESDLPVSDKLVQIIKGNCVHLKQIAAG